MTWSVQNNCAGAIKGILLPARWDPCGQVIGLMLAAFDERNYYLEENDRQTDWLQYLTRTVAVRGEIRPRDDHYWISVQSLEPLGQTKGH